MPSPKVRICLWYDGTAEEAAVFEAMMPMRKVDIATIVAARQGRGS